jgi:hypothetical protein
VKVKQLVEALAVFRQLGQGGAGQPLALQLLLQHRQLQDLPLGGHGPDQGPGTG